LRAICFLFPGQICIDPSTGALKNQDIQQETHQVMHNLRSILTAADMTFHNVVKTTIFITDMNRFSEINDVYGKYFDSNGSFPARGNCAGVGIAKVCECGDQHDRSKINPLSSA
jgi:2-iminobutanoate/2-iminopropanoate deaminase